MCNEDFWPGLKIDPGIIFQRWILTRGGHFSTLKIETKIVKFIPGVIFQRYEKDFSKLWWPRHVENWSCWELTPTSESWSELELTLHGLNVQSCTCLKVSVLKFSYCPIHMRTWLIYFRLIYPNNHFNLRLKIWYPYFITILNLKKSEYFPDKTINK